MPITIVFAFFYFQGVFDLEERLKEVRQLLGETSAEGENGDISEQETSNNEESPVEMIH